jgi:aldose 1-epimerase
VSFEVNTFEGMAGDRAGTVYELTDGTVRAEVWPQWGFNCVRWQVKQPDGSWAGVFYTAPDWESNPVPTRSGHPVLFPFPGRLRDGRLPGSAVQLPLNDSTKQHAIHGFTPRTPWRVVGSFAGHDSATVAGQFRLADDLPAAVGQWPGDFVLNLSYFLMRDCLRVDVGVENRGAEAMPFGIGYHPYFRLPGVTDADVGGHILSAHVSEVWAADAANLPTGERKPVPPDLDFRQPRPVGATALDHVLTGVTTTAGADGLVELAVLTHPAASGRLRVLADPAFSELVLFTPAHRQAVAIEPYSCSADASNLQARGIDSGWRTLAPGGSWTAAVEYRWEPI